MPPGYFDVGRKWCGPLSLSLGLLAVCTPFTMRLIDFTALGEPAGELLGEPAGELLSVSLTWLSVILPVLGLGIGVAGLAHERSKAVAIVAVLVNTAGIGLAALIVYILAG